MMTNRPSQPPKYLPIQAYQYYNQTLLGILPFPPPTDTIYPPRLHPQNAPLITKNINSLPLSIGRLLMPVSSSQVQQARPAAQAEFQKPVVSYNSADGARLRDSQDLGAVYIPQSLLAPGPTASASHVQGAGNESDEKERKRAEKKEEGWVMVSSRSASAGKKDGDGEEGGRDGVRFQVIYPPVRGCEVGGRGYLEGGRGGERIFGRRMRW
ncbi:hypothetical protein EX30DRAFT_364992 [Ascodesmis nigricans]|uniref:Uncharacterized protein n=1 Tax=Ascodesmis nigricans TaxID=341454 RepID=A0A4S2MTA3_9PEZI|nr:hypothetical protein EX30DRAFT_364992 [Ascodesmis nigricans]